MDVLKFTKKCWGGGRLRCGSEGKFNFGGTKKGCSFKLQQKPKMVKQLAQGMGGGGTCVDVSIAVVRKLLF